MLIYFIFYSAAFVGEQHVHGLILHQFSGDTGVNLRLVARGTSVCIVLYIEFDSLFDSVALHTRTHSSPIQ
jgi:hypothetical protein